MTEPSLTDNFVAADEADREVSSAQSICLDHEKYRDKLKQFELTKEREDELLQILWNIMSTMVDIGWGVDTVQMFLPDLFQNSVQDSGKLLEVIDPQTPEKKDQDNG